jgi:hypothetical protein
VPLEAYAGVAEIPAPAAARAVAAACASLASMLQKEPLLAPLTMTRFINRERGILERGGAAGEAAGPSRRWRPAEHAAGQGESLSWAATDAETGGAHVVPYWSAARTPGENALTFEPLRDPGRGERAGALAFCIFPAGERLLEAELPDDPEGETKLRARLRRRAPFSASFASGRLVKIVEAASELPMA